MKRPLTPLEVEAARQHAIRTPNAARDFVQARTESTGQIPDVVADAMFPVGATIAGFPLLPFRTGVLGLLHKLGNPIAKSLFLDKKDAAKIEVTVEDWAQVFFVVTRPVKESRDLLLLGREKFDEAFHAFADDLPVGDFLRDSEKLQLWILDGFATALPMVQKKTEPPKPSGPEATRATPDLAGG
jgi:hypothetical protein